MDCQVCERKPLRCVPVPGEASWAPEATGLAEDCCIYVSESKNDLLPWAINEIHWGFRVTWDNDCIFITLTQSNFHLKVRF